MGWVIRARCRRAEDEHGREDRDLVAADDGEDVVVTVPRRELADESNLGEGAALVPGILNDDAVTVERCQSLGASEHSDIDTGGAETSGADRTVHAGTDDQHSGVIVLRGRICLRGLKGRRHGRAVRFEAIRKGCPARGFDQPEAERDFHQGLSHGAHFTPIGRLLFPNCRRILQRLFPDNGSVHLLSCVSAAGRDALSQGDDYATGYGFRISFPAILKALQIAD